MLDDNTTTQDKQRVRHQDNEFAFPLSFLLGLSSFAAIFFGVWRLSHEVALIGTAIVSPVIVRTVWLCEEAAKLRQPLTLRQTLTAIVTSFAMVFGAIVCFLVVFLTLLALIVLAGIGLGVFTRGEDGASEGAVIGAIIGLLVGGGGAVYITVWLTHLMWRRQGRNQQPVAG